MAACSLKMRHLRTDERCERGLEESQTASLVEHVGQYNDHAVVKRLAFSKETSWFPFMEGKTS